MSEKLGQLALENLRKSGVEVILNSRVVGATEHALCMQHRLTEVKQIVVPDVVLILILAESA